MNAHMISTSRVLLSAFLLVSMIGCSPESPKKTEFKPIEKVRTSENASFNPKVDILFVIDDSSSMDAKQKNLARNIELFTDEVQRAKLLDYHIGVVSSTFYKFGSTCKSSYKRPCGDGILYGGSTNTPFVTRDTPNGLSILAENIMVGTGGSLSEKFFEPVRAALIDPVLSTQNKGFYREDASIVVIFVTDTEDQSTSLDPKSFTQFLVGLKNGNARKALTYGVYIRDESEQVGRCTIDDESKGRLNEAIAIGGGGSFNLCDPDFGTKLGEMAADLAQKVSKNLFLNRRPDDDTIVVTYGSQIIENDVRTGWTYDASINAIAFGDGLQLSAQPEGTQIEVNYKAAREE